MYIGAGKYATAYELQIGRAWFRVVHLMGGRWTWWAVWRRFQFTWCGDDQHPAHDNDDYKISAGQWKLLLLAAALVVLGPLLFAEVRLAGPAMALEFCQVEARP